MQTTLQLKNTAWSKTPPRPEQKCLPQGTYIVACYTEKQNQSSYVLEENGLLRGVCIFSNSASLLRVSWFYMLALISYHLESPSMLCQVAVSLVVLGMHMHQKGSIFFKHPPA